MDQSELVVGEDYAYLVPKLTPHQPVRAVLTDEPQGGYVVVTLYYPDTGQSEERIKTRELVGRWEDEPEGKPQYENALAAAHERGEKLTWAAIAQQRYEVVQRQRALASRLSNFGIYRQARNYAGQGGTSRKPHDTDLQLNYDEIELLLGRAEGGTAQSYIPADDVDPTRVPDTDDVP